MDIEKKFDTAFRYHQKGDLDNAETLYKKILELEPNHPRTNFLFGTLFIQKKDYFSAKKKFIKAVSISPNNFYAYNYLGIIHKELKIFEEAKRYFDKAISLNQDYDEAYYNLGLLFKDVEDYKNAKKYYQKTILINPNHINVYNNLGNMCNILGEKKNAIKYFNKAIEINPENAQAYNNLGNRFKESGEYKKSIEAYSKAIQINPNLHQVYENLGNVFRIKKNFKKAIEYFEKSKSENSKAQLLECIYFLYGLKNYKEKLETYAKKDFLNRRIGTISSYVSATTSLKNIFPFCKNPIEYFYKTNIGNDLFNKEKIQKNLLSFLENSDLVWEPSSKTTTKGYRTTGNLFEGNNIKFKKLIELIKKALTCYRQKFSNSDDLIIKKWPKKYTLNAWYVKLIQQGYQTSHIHPEGWISGVFYLKVPKFINGQDGAIILTLDGYDYPANKKLPNLIHSPKDFDLILFPSSLFHRTIPLKSKETRHVIAFDLVPLKDKTNF